MSIFMYSGKEAAFLDAIEGAAAGLPILGDPSSQTVLGLVHYSKNISIPEFGESIAYNWTHRVSDQSAAVAAITQLGDIRFQALYVIRVGFSDLFRARVSNVGVTSEYALGIGVPGGTFAKLLLSFDAETGLYSVA